MLVTRTAVVTVWLIGTSAARVVRRTVLASAIVELRPIRLWTSCSCGRQSPRGRSVPRGRSLSRGRSVPRGRSLSRGRSMPRGRSLSQGRFGIGGGRSLARTVGLRADGRAWRAARSASRHRPAACDGRRLPRGFARSGLGGIVRGDPARPIGVSRTIVSRGRSVPWTTVDRSAPASPDADGRAAGVDRFAHPADREGGDRVVVLAHRAAGARRGTAVDRRAFDPHAALRVDRAADDRCRGRSSGTTGRLTAGDRARPPAGAPARFCLNRSRGSLCCPPGRQSRPRSSMTRRRARRHVPLLASSTGDRLRTT